MFLTAPSLASSKLLTLCIGHASLALLSLNHNSQTYKDTERQQLSLLPHYLIPQKRHKYRHHWTQIAEDGIRSIG